jgi:protein-disulfide isomerase
VSVNDNLSTHDDDSYIANAAYESQPDQSSQPIVSFSSQMVNTLVVGVVFLIVGLLLGANIGDSGVNSTQVRAIVQDVVSEEMGKIETALTTATSASDGYIDPAQLQELVQNAVNQAVNERSYMDDDDPSIGPEDAPVVMVEFSDFLCGFCGRHYQNTLTPLLENYEGYIRYVYRDFPGVGGQNAFVSAEAGECAQDQDSFWQFHNMLFDNQASLGGNDMDALREVLIGYAGDLNMDVETFRTCLETEQYATDVVLDSQDAQAVGARGTPGFVINGKFYSGAQPYDFFARIINAELEKQGIVVGDA